MNYLESLEYLDELSTFGTKLGLGRIKQLVTYLDNPQTRYKTIHITAINITLTKTKIIQYSTISTYVRLHLILKHTNYLHTTKTSQIGSIPP